MGMGQGVMKFSGIFLDMTIYLEGFRGSFRGDLLCFLFSIFMGNFGNFFGYFGEFGNFLAFSCKFGYQDIFFYFGDFLGKLGKFALNFLVFS